MSSSITLTEHAKSLNGVAAKVQCHLIASKTAGTSANLQRQRGAPTLQGRQSKKELT
ncbi:hypothetical protein SpCBS45565_g07798 [Spizellomyces sp. 'palustris']|nr:hypothetical protein SpCBS45565_g07798 [Spizellomyces sp. 'palustris']